MTKITCMKLNESDTIGHTSMGGVIRDGEDTTLHIKYAAEMKRT